MAINVGQKLASLAKEQPQLDYAKAGIGVFHTPGPEMPGWYKEALAQKNGVVPPSTYHFAGDPKFLETTARLIFGDEVDMKALFLAPSYGGTQAISLGNHALRDIVPCGVPTWVNHEATINAGGSIFFPFKWIDENGEFNVDQLMASLDRERVISELMEGTHSRALEAFCRVLEVDSGSLTEQENGNPMIRSWLGSKKISPLIQAVCNNPLGVDIPQQHWERIANKLVERDITLQIDLAYLGFGKGVSEDSAMLKFFKSRGVKMMVYFSYSKFHGHYADRRAGAVLGVNLEQDPQVGAQIRNSTSAVAIDGQRLSTIIESNEGIRAQQRAWVALLRESALANRKILEEALVGTIGQGIMAPGTGPFFFAPDPKVQGKRHPLMPHLFPELAYRLGFKVPKAAQDFPKDRLRVVGIPVLHEESSGISGVRLALPTLTPAIAGDVGATLRRAYLQIASSAS